MHAYVQNLSNQKIIVIKAFGKASEKFGLVIEPPILNACSISKKLDDKSDIMVFP